jgi:AcrR family transcriptional regulator
MSIERKRLSPAESRFAALDAARTLLIEVGAQAVTLKAVSARIGRTHANVLHHFGSAEGLQKALATSLALQVCEMIEAEILKVRRGESEPSRVVDLTFDAFEAQGLGALCTWMITSGNLEVLDPILEALLNLLHRIGDGHGDRETSKDTLTLVLMAMGDALLGAPMAKALGLPRQTAREIALKQLLNSPGVAAQLGLA